MRLHLLAFLSIGLGTTPAVAQAPSVERIVIRAVTVVDGTSAAPQADRSVLLADGKIAAIGGSDLDAGDAREVDGHGRFLIPGLWDMHVHMTAMAGFAELYVCNGVTGIRDMFSPMAQIRPVRKKIAAGERPGPRIVAAGRIVDGDPPIWPGSIVARNAEEGTKAVATVVDEGADFVKVYSLLPRDAYFAIAAACQERGVVFAGHVPRTVGIVEAAAAGQRSIEHLTGVLEFCSKDPKAGDATLTREERAKAQCGPLAEDKVTELGKALVAHETWLCPTLTVLRAIANLDDETFKRDERVRYLSPFFVQMWLPKNDRRFAAMTAADWQAQKQVYERDREVARQLHAAGVHFLAGTDTGNPFCFPGFSLHDELQLLVGIGLSPREALASATSEAARYLGIAAETGTIEVGKAASLVLLDADPLQDIANTRKIAAVVVDGRLYDRSALDALLEQVTPAKK